MSCTNTTAMYLNVSTDICASASASRSGSTVTVSGTFSVSQGSTWNYNAIYAYVDGQTTWTKVKPYKSDGGGYWEASFSFSFNDSGAGTRNYTAIFQVWNNAESGTVGNPASVGFSVSYNADITAPTGLALSNVSVTSDTVTGTVSVTGWGGGGDANSRYRNLSVRQVADSNTVRRYQRVYGNTQSSAITVNNSTQYGSMTIIPNTQYWLWWYATNGTYGAEAPSPSTTSVVTLPPTPTISNTGVTASTATFTYSVPNQGGKYNMTLKKRVDGGAPETITTLTGSGTKSGTFTVTGLTSSATHTVAVTLSTSAGETVSNTVTFTTATPNPILYGSVSGSTKKVKKLYGPVEVSESFSITPDGTVVQAIDGVLLCATAKSQYPNTYKNAAYFVFTYSSGTYSARGFDWGSNQVFYKAGSFTALRNVGITFVSPLLSGKSVTIPASYVTNCTISKEIKKLYGSVNGRTKIIY